MSQNIIDYMLFHYKNVDWNYKILSYNPNITEWTLSKLIDKDWDFNALTIKKVQNSYSNISEFDRNYSLYGYKFPTSDYYAWQNKDWTFSSAVEKSKCLKKLDADRKYLSCWRLGEVSIHGKSLTELMQIKRVDLDHNLLKLQSNQFVNKYYDSQMNLT